MAGYGKGRPRVKGDYADYCSYCGSKFFRSELVRERTGKLRCPDEGEGLDEASLAELEIANTRAVTERMRSKRRDL